MRRVTMPTAGLLAGTHARSGTLADVALARLTSEGRADGAWRNRSSAIEVIAQQTERRLAVRRPQLSVTVVKHLHRTGSVRRVGLGVGRHQPVRLSGADGRRAS